MEEQPREDPQPLEPSDAEDGAPTSASGSGTLPEGPEARALALEAEEIRRLVEAGAGSPEAIRELAARLREHRAREEALWRAEVKPALVKEGKGRLRPQRPPEVTPQKRSASNSLWLGLVLLGLVLVAVLAANTTAWVLILPLIALIGYAWHQGRDRVP